MGYLLISALLFLHNLLYRPLSMDIMLFIYETVLNLNFDLFSYKSTFLLTVLSAFPESPHLTALRLKLPVYELNHPKITQWCHTLSIWQIDKVIILMRENVFFQALPEGKKKKCKDNVWWKCTMSIVCQERESQCSSCVLFYSK